MEFSLKPVFVGWTTFLAQLPLQLFLTAFCAIFFGIATAALFNSFEGDFDPGNFLASPGFAAFGLLAFVGVPLAILIGKKMNYARTEYRFYKDHLEFEEGFLAVKKKEIRYSDVKEITLRKGVLQRMCGLGTVYLATMATGSSPDSQPFSNLAGGSASASGISIRDVRDSDAVYDKLRTLISPRP